MLFHYCKRSTLPRCDLLLCAPVCGERPQGPVVPDAQFCAPCLPIAAGALDPCAG